MLKFPLSLRLTTGFVVIMIGTLLLSESLDFHFRYLTGLLAVIAILGAAISLFIITRNHHRIDLAAVAPILFESTLDALTEGVVLLDNRERIVIANATFANIVGTTPASLKNISISCFGWTLLHSHENEMPWTRAILSRSQQTNVQMTLSGNTGRGKIFVIDSAPIQNSNGESGGVMITFDDVTRMEEKNDQLETMLDMLKKSRDEVRRQNKVLEQLATRDSLTNCLNRRSFFEKYSTVFDAAKRGGHALSCIMTDIDLFKTINDRHGHTSGDEVIKGVAETLANSLQAADSVCRYGGEEFCIVLPGINLAEAQSMAEHARLSIEQLDLRNEADKLAIPITSSFGVSSNEHDPASLSELIDRADKALYQSKHGGRNCVTAWDRPQQEHKQAIRNTTENIASTTSDNHDTLTGLPDRDEFNYSVATAIQTPHTSGQHAAIMMLDLGMFKRINSTYGYAVGDDLLKIVSARLADVLRNTDTVARLNNVGGTTSIYRLGGDEFGILLSNLDCTDFISAIVNRAIESVTARIDIQGNEFHLTCSVGVSLFPDHGISAEALLKNASTALYYAKLQGQNLCNFYHEELNKDSLEDMQLENDLHHVIERDELELYYQPKIDLASGRVTSVEALLRWQHPRLGMIPPAEFIPIAEETGLIIDIGYHVLEHACLQLRQWQDEGYEDISVAVNLSAVQFSQRDLLKRILTICEETRICPNKLELEITESTIMQDIDAAASTLRALHCSGMHISIDDFGTGYSSLNHLKRFPINTVKIDRTFIRDITSDLDDAAIVRAIISMAHDMGLRALAEGVETRAQLEILRELQCDEIQGFLFSPPVPQQQATALFNQHIEMRLQQATLVQAESG
jgi:diguanylate cyclase (GGDEF)-like protein